MFLEEFIEQNTIKRKRTNSMVNLRPHSQTITSATTCDDSTCLEDTNINININQLIESNNEIKINKTQKEDNKKDKKKKGENSKDKKTKEKNDIKNNENNIFKLSNTAVINPNNFIDIYTEHSTKTMKVFTYKKDKKNNSKEKENLYILI